MEASKTEVKERISASKKLSEKEARNLLKSASKLIVAKGKKLDEFDTDKSVSREAVAAMLGPTGNLRAPTICVGKTVMVGFNEHSYKAILC